MHVIIRLIMNERKSLELSQVFFFFYLTYSIVNMDLQKTASEVIIEPLILVVTLQLLSATLSLVFDRINFCCSVV